MTQCNLIRYCPLFRAGASGVTSSELEDYKRKYCRADRFSCARYLVATSVGHEKVPVDLSPHESDRALKILRAAG